MTATSVRWARWAFFWLLCFGGVGECEAMAPVEFGEIPWKASVAETKRIMSQRPGVRMTGESPQLLVFEGGMFAGQPVQRWELEFTALGFSAGTAHIAIPMDGRAEATKERKLQIATLESALTEKYGKVKPGKGDRHEFSYWRWPVSDPQTGARGEVSILLDFGWKPTREVKVRYTYGAHVDPDAVSSSPPVNKDL